MPRPHASDTRHPVDDPDILLVHVTHYNRLMWDNGRTPTIVIEHGVSLDENVRYQRSKVHKSVSSSFLLCQQELQAVLLVTLYFSFMVYIAIA